MMPWQQHVLDVALELDADGHPAYRRVVLTVPRQSGKTTLQLALFVHRALAWGSPQVMAYAAQTGKDARKKLIEQPNGQIPMLQRSPFRSMFRPRLATGHEAILWNNGSRHSLAANTEKSGHGDTLDLGFIDEAFSQVDARLEQAFSPAMSTRRDAQLWVVSTMGTESSVYLNSKVDAGRLLAEDPHCGTAYFEWSADDDADIDDPATWWSCMPALGITVTEETIRSELVAMRAEGNEDEFRRAYLNQRRVAESMDDALSNWGALADPMAAATGPLWLGVDVAPSMGSAAITVHGAGVLELAEERSGSAWVPDRLAELRQRHHVVGWGAIKGAPAEALAPDLPDDGVWLSPVDARSACARLARAVADGDVQHLDDPRLNLAVRGARRKFSGDGWVWTRSGSATSIAPLYAGAVALWLGTTRDATDRSTEALLSSFG